jgi:hypothetical protein
VKKKKQKVAKRVLSILSYPKSDDKVYAVLEDIFNSNSEHVLTRDMSIRHKIKRLAWRRFILGYPPRKRTDTSMGDAINWEWIVHCASFLSGRLIIVSRDSDFGCEQSGKYFLNDQLKEEFRDRAGRKSIVYTRKLSDALKSLKISVTAKEMKAEEDTLRIAVHDNISSSDVTDIRAPIHQIEENAADLRERLRRILENTRRNPS